MVEQPLRKGKVGGSTPLLGSQFMKSRLEIRNEKKYFQKIIVYFFLFILFIAFIVTFGIKILINITLFIADITHPKIENSLPKNQKNEVLLPPEVYEIPSATNSSKIIVKGKANAGKNLSFFINNSFQKEITLEDDLFETELELSSSENLIYLVLKNPKTKEKKQSEVYRVIYKKEKPKLEIISPKDQEKVNQEEIKILGKTEKEVFVKINDLPVVVGADGQFSYQLKLQPGENKISITATDIAGNVETKELTIIYQKED